MDTDDIKFWREQAHHYELLYQGQKEIAEKYKDMYLELLEEKQRIEKQVNKKLD